MRERLTKVQPPISRHLGKRSAETALYARRLGEHVPDFPQGHSGPGGGIFLTNDEQLGLYLLSFLASSTALSAPEAVQLYRGLVGQTKESRNEVNEVSRRYALNIDALRTRRALAEVRGEAVLAAELGKVIDESETSRLTLEELRRGQEPLPEILRDIHDHPGTLLSIPTRLIGACRTKAGRERLTATLEFEVWRHWPRAILRVNDWRSGWRFHVEYLDDGDRGLTKAQRNSSMEMDARFPCIVSDRIFRDIGEALGAADRPEQEQARRHEGAPPAEADGAPSVVSRRRPNAGRRRGCKPRANAPSSAVPAGQYKTADARMLAEQAADGSLPLSHRLQDDGEQSHGPPQHPPSDPPTPRLR